MGGPCLAHKPWPENHLRQVGTGSSVFPLIKRRGGADAFLREQRRGGRWGLPAAPCCSAAVLHPGTCVPRAWRRAVLLLYETPCFLSALPLGCCFDLVFVFFSSFRRSQRKCLSVVPALGDFWKCRVVPSCRSISCRMAWRGPTFSRGNAFPRPPAKTFLFSV